MLNLAKGLGEARRVDEAFQMLESIDKGSAFGGLQLSAHVIYGLLNSLLQSGLSYDLVNPFSSLLYYQWMKWFRFFQTKKDFKFCPGQLYSVSMWLILFSCITYLASSVKLFAKFIALEKNDNNVIHFYDCLLQVV